MNNETILIKTVLNSAFVSFDKLWRSQKLLTPSSTSIILQMILSLIQRQSWLLIIINPLLGAIFMCPNYYNVFCKHINSESIIFLLNLVWLELQCKICVWITRCLLIAYNKRILSKSALAFFQTEHCYLRVTDQRSKLQVQCSLVV